MSANSKTTVFSVKEAYAFPLLQDIEGQRPVFGRGTKIYGIQNISKTENLAIVNCPGDGTNIDSQSEIESIELSIEYGKMSHSLDTLIKGGLHRLQANESQHILGGSDQGKKFCLKFRASKLGAPGCDYVLTIFSVVAGTNARSNANKEFQTNTFDASAAQIAGKVFHPDGNDWYIEQVRSSALVEAIDSSNPFPDLPAALTALTVASTSVAEGDAAVAVNASPAITFSAAVDDLYVNSDYFYIVAGDGSGIVPAAVTRSTVTVTINPTSNFTLSGAYTIVVDPSVASATNGIALNKTVLINFTVVAS